MILSSRKLLAGLLGISAVATVVVACGSSDDSKFNDNGVKPGFFQDAGFGEGGGDDPNGLLFKDDPPPAWCGPDAGVTLPDIGGTPECPDDKNKPGCGCVNVGDTAKCWTGLRKNRGLGICADGNTVCQKKTENENAWGPCEGQVLPKPDATGKLACSCFSVGTWKIKNTSPCIWKDGTGYYAYSTVGDLGTKCSLEDHLARGQAAGLTSREALETELKKEPSTNPSTWSTDTLTTDCAGSFTLIFRIRVGDFKNPKATDCILGESETFADYQKENVEQPLPPLHHWNTTDTACATAWETGKAPEESPGYGEMIVRGGRTIRCESVADAEKDQEFVFNRVQFCGKACRPGADGTVPNIPQCNECKLNGQGSFK